MLEGLHWKEQIVLANKKCRHGIQFFLKHKNRRSYRSKEWNFEHVEEEH